MYSLNKDLKNPEFPIGLLTIEEFLTDVEIQVLLTYKHKLIKAKLGENNDIKNIPGNLLYNNENKAKKNEIRNSNIAWIDYNKTNTALKNLFKKIYTKIIDVNQNEFLFNLTDVEPFQFTSYKVGEYFTKHLDVSDILDMGNTQRKLSFTIQLSDKEDYDGGELLIHHSSRPTIASKSKGSISFFSSFMLHEVTEVTRGERYSLVGWVWGPRFV